MIVLILLLTILAPVVAQAAPTAPEVATTVRGIGFDTADGITLDRVAAIVRAARSAEAAFVAETATKDGKTRARLVVNGLVPSQRLNTEFPAALQGAKVLVIERTHHSVARAKRLQAELDRVRQQARDLKRQLKAHQVAASTQLDRADAALAAKSRKLAQAGATIQKQSRQIRSLQGLNKKLTRAASKAKRGREIATKELTIMLDAIDGIAGLILALSILLITAAISRKLALGVLLSLIPVPTIPLVAIHAALMVATFAAAIALLVSAHFGSLWIAERIPALAQRVAQGAVAAVAALAASLIPSAAWAASQGETMLVTTVTQIQSLAPFALVGLVGIAAIVAAAAVWHRNALERYGAGHDTAAECLGSLALAAAALITLFGAVLTGGLVGFGVIFTYGAAFVLSVAVLMLPALLIHAFE